MQDNPPIPSTPHDATWHLYAATAGAPDRLLAAKDEVRALARLCCGPPKYVEGGYEVRLANRIFQSIGNPDTPQLLLHDQTKIMIFSAFATQYQEFQSRNVARVENPAGTQVLWGLFETRWPDTWVASHALEIPVDIEGQAPISRTQIVVDSFTAFVVGLYEDLPVDRTSIRAEYDPASGLLVALRFRIIPSEDTHDFVRHSIQSVILSAIATREAVRSSLCEDSALAFASDPVFEAVMGEGAEKANRLRQIVQDPAKLACMRDEIRRMWMRYIGPAERPADCLRVNISNRIRWNSGSAHVVAAEKIRPMIIFSAFADHYTEYASIERSIEHESVELWEARAILWKDTWVPPTIGTEISPIGAECGRYGVVVDQFTAFLAGFFSDHPGTPGSYVPQYDAPTGMLDGITFSIDTRNMTDERYAALRKDVLEVIASAVIAREASHEFAQQKTAAIHAQSVEVLSQKIQKSLVINDADKERAHMIQKILDVIVKDTSEVRELRRKKEKQIKAARERQQKEYEEQEHHQHEYASRRPDVARLRDKHAKKQVAEMNSDEPAAGTIEEMDDNEMAAGTIEEMDDDETAAGTIEEIN